MSYKPLILLAILTIACSPSPSTPQETTQRIHNTLQAHLDRADVHHVILNIDAPKHGLTHTWALGQASPNTPMTPDTAFLSASIGKLFISTTIALLVQRGELSLQDRMVDLLPQTHWHDLPSRRPLSDITLRDLISHTSGLADYFSGPMRDNAPNVLDLMVSQPQRSWIRDDLFQHTRTHALPPTTPFAYSDTNYDLLGLILEAKTNTPFHHVVRREILNPLQLSQTWYHAFETQPSSTTTIASTWHNNTPLQTPALSADQAGGGLRTTTQDLSTFLRALATGKLGVTFDTLSSWTPDALESGIDYGLGLWRIRPHDVFFLLSDPVALGVSGSTGSFAYYIPQHDATVTGTFDQTRYAEEHIKVLLTDIFPALSQTQLRPE